MACSDGRRRRCGRCCAATVAPRLRLPARQPVERYERERPGELIHIDIKRLGRFWTIGKAILGDRLHRSRHAGWQYLHLAVDDHSRLAYAELLPSESPADCVAFLRRALAWYAEQGVIVERVLTDNGNGYRSHAWAAACADLGVARRYTRPRRPQTNGKAEALVKTLQREWAYRFPYPTSAHRAKALPGYLRWYNRHRPHSSLGRRTAAQSRLTALWVPHLAAALGASLQAVECSRAPHGSSDRATAVRGG